MGCNILNTISDRILGISRDRLAVVKSGCKRAHALLAHLDALALGWAQRAAAYLGVPVPVPVPVPSLGRGPERTTYQTGTARRTVRVMRWFSTSSPSGFSRSSQS